MSRQLKRKSVGEKNIFSDFRCVLLDSELSGSGIYERGFLFRSQVPGI